MHRNLVRFLFPAAILIVGLIAMRTGHRVDAGEYRQILFPVLGGASYGNDFGNPRVGHTHQGNDLFRKKMTPVIAVADGVLQRVSWPQPSYGYFISLEDDEGWDYWYIHLNNDKPGTDDGNGGGNFAYAPGAEDGARVKAGQVIGYVGDSGNAEPTPPHLHFEIHRPTGAVINPYESLQRATVRFTPVRRDALPGEIFPYGTFPGGAYVAMGDVFPEHEGVEIVTGAGAGGGPNVQILTTGGAQLAGWFSHSTKYFRGGTDVAVGNVTGDAGVEIIAAPASNASPYVRVLSPAGSVLKEFLAFPRTFTGGVSVTTADLDGDGLSEIIVGAGKGFTPTVRIFTGQGVFVKEFLAYAAGFRGGIDVAGVSASTEDQGYIVTSPLGGGGPNIRTYRQDGTMLGSFFSGSSKFRGGMRVTATREETGGLRISTIPASGQASQLRFFTFNGEPRGETATIFEEWWGGGFDIATDGVTWYGTTLGGRQTSLRSFSPPVTTPDEEPTGVVGE